MGFSKSILIFHSFVLILSILPLHSVIESTEKNIIRNKRSTQVNRLIDNSIVIVVPIHFGDDTSCSTSMQYASDSELDIAVLWIGFVDRLTVGRSTVKNNLLPFNKVDGTSNFIGTNFPVEVFALSKPCLQLNSEPLSPPPTVQHRPV